MARRTLRRIDPELDLATHLLTLEELSPPLDAAAVFGRVAPLEVEIGSGKGLFVSAAASEDPAADYLGIEVVAKYARFAASRLAKRALPNARMIHGDALRLFREFLTGNSLRAVHVYFPDPWWKARHRKRRVMNGPLLKDVERTLVSGGTLHFWTDVEEYYQTSLEVIAAETTLSGPLAVAEKPADHDLDYRTHFERRMRLHNEPIYRAEFRKP